MSKLTHYKKPPAVKLPRFLPKKGVKLLDSEDDDFQISKTLKGAPDKQPATHQTSTSSSTTSKKNKKGAAVLVSSGTQVLAKDRKTVPPTCNTSLSEYFEIVKKREISDQDDESPTSITNVKCQNQDEPDFSCSTSQQSRVLISKIPDEEQNKEMQPIMETDANPEGDTPMENTANKAVCPFCWKRLNDKLTGTTHVKSCAKNMPTNQIFEALQLQEKQIKEWEKLGIAYPGFSDGPSAAGRKGRNKAPRSRKKKQDPELELAIALSESLHEEVERRRHNENEFIIENGLQNEIALTPTSKKQDVAENSKRVGPVVTIPPKNSKRGKKTNILDLPLYTATETTKKAEVEKMLNIILDGNENGLNAERAFYIRDQVSPKTIKLPSKLEPYRNKDANLWNLSASDGPTKDMQDEFVTSIISECKSRQPRSTPRIPTETTEGECKAGNKIIHVPPNSSCGSDGTKQSGSKMLGRSGSLLSTNPERHLKDISPKIARSNAESKLGAKMNTSQSQLINDFLRMFVTTEDSDLTIYGREEKRIKCHKFVVKARCRILLNDIVKETNSKGVQRDIVPLTCFSHKAVKAFVKFLYCGHLSGQLSGQDLEDIKELGSKYELDFSITEKQSESPESSSSETVQNLPSQSGEDADSAPLKSRCDRVRHNASRRGSVDMFADVDGEGSEAASQRIPEDRPLQTGCNKDMGGISHEHPPIPITKSHTNDAYDTDNKISFPQPKEPRSDKKCPDESHPPKVSEPFEMSRDLFEDFDDDFDFELNLEENLEAKKQIKSASPKKEELAVEVEVETVCSDDGILEDELCTQRGSSSRILLSPKPYKYNKRSRSVSPTNCDFSGTKSLTATQMADYIQFGQVHSSPNHQAIKKHKLDHESTLVDRKYNGNNDSIELIEIDSEEINCFTELRKDTFGTFEDSFVDSGKYTNKDSNLGVDENRFPSVSSDILITKSFLPQLISTPAVNLSFPNPNLHSCPSPLQNPERNDFDDPFANDDDSCFLNVPSILLQNPTTPCRKSNFQSRPTRLSSISPAEMQNQNYDQPQNVEPIKILQKTDGRTQPKKKGRKAQKRSLSQEPSPVVNRQPCLLNHLKNSKTNANHLDYSTIDTPLLKKELKRYGLKPLPRSKAKLILRHIVQETNKD